MLDTIDEAAASLDMDAVRGLRDQCGTNRVAFHHKQNGGIHGKAPVMRATLAASNDPIRLGSADVDRTEQRLRRDSVPRCRSYFFAFVTSALPVVRAVDANMRFPQREQFMEEMVEYRGYVVFWRRFSNDGPWLACIAAASPSLFPATAQSAAADIHGRNRDDMLANAKIYIDRLLRPNGALSSAELREPSIA